MTKKSVNSSVKKPNLIMEEQKKQASVKNCCDKKWNLVPLRFALGLMFLASGLPMIISLIDGGNQIPIFFAGLGIPLAGFFAWVVALSEIIGGVFLLLGFMTWWTSLVLGIIMIVAALLTTLSPFNWQSLTKHFVYIAGLIAVMYGSKYFSLKQCDCKCSCHK
jgi:uncharacterized membrane protein YphA (DoxX/SURF4 family)